MIVNSRGRQSLLPISQIWIPGLSDPAVRSGTYATSDNMWSVDSRSGHVHIFTVFIAPRGRFCAECFSVRHCTTCDKHNDHFRYVSSGVKYVDVAARTHFSLD
jgi:hypothetical protein